MNHFDVGPKSNAAFYQSAEFKQYHELVRFFHEAWGHPSRELMCFIVKNRIFKNIHPDLTEKVIRRHFPHCEACPAGNMAQRDKPHSLPPSTSPVAIGSVWHVDIKVFADTSKARKHKRAIGGYTSAMNCIDQTSDFVFGYLLKNHQNLENYLDKLRLQVHAQHRTIVIIHIDNEYIPESILAWALENHITLLPCIPHEHWSIGAIERYNRTLGDGITKQLYGKPHLNITYWGYAG